MSVTTPRVLFFGTCGAFSGPPLDALMAAGVSVAALVLPPARTLPMLAAAPTILDLARAHGLPILELELPGDGETPARLAAFQPDLICVACFPRILPPPLLTLPRLGCLNVHPSLLPRHRGPAPLFWTFYHGDAVAGATIHKMTGRVDAGEILFQSPVPIPDGINGAELEQACAAVGGRLLVEAVRGVASGALVPRPQREADATLAPWPTRRDLEVPLAWPAERAHRFIRGVAGWYPLTLTLPGSEGATSLGIRHAIGLESEEALPRGQGFRLVEGEAWVRFSEGVLRVAVW
jgi:methionyl-tRNA formyltransferase